VIASQATNDDKRVTHRQWHTTSFLPHCFVKENEVKMRLCKKPYAAQKNIPLIPQPTHFFAPINFFPYLCTRN
jgi:hypothetical protein